MTHIMVGLFNQVFFIKFVRLPIHSSKSYIAFTEYSPNTSTSAFMLCSAQKIELVSHANRCKRWRWRNNVTWAHEAVEISCTLLLLSVIVTEVLPICCSSTSTSFSKVFAISQFRIHIPHLPPSFHLLHGPLRAREIHKIKPTKQVHTYLNSTFSLSGTIRNIIWNVWMGFLLAHTYFYLLLTAVAVAAAKQWNREDDGNYVYQ